MKHTNIRIARLKEMMALEEKRAALHGHITAINERLSAIQNELYGSSVSRAFQAKEKRALAPKKTLKLRRKGRGELKGEILEILQATGAQGSSVKELAARIGVKPANVHSWFSANMKKIAGLKKIGEARYAINGAAGVVEKPAKKGAKVKKVKAVKVAKSARKAKSSKGRAGRGVLKDQILNALKDAGDNGISIKDLSEQLKANYKNIYIWFVTTGKRIAEIKKVGPAQYKLEAAA
ncbi:MAG: hypothetical protein PHQ12_03125 [Chthoniobacteraceae bacterium]|nr:hypothetical protein [Chthoniobacteraceae bacterium]